MILVVGNLEKLHIDLFASSFFLVAVFWLLLLHFSSCCHLEPCHFCEEYSIHYLMKVKRCRESNLFLKWDCTLSVLLQCLFNFLNQKQKRMQWADWFQNLSANGTFQFRTPCVEFRVGGVDPGCRDSIAVEKESAFESVWFCCSVSLRASHWLATAVRSVLRTGLLQKTALEERCLVLEKIWKLLPLSHLLLTEFSRAPFTSY